MNVYISGPMTGHDNFNFAAFFEAEEKLRCEGHNPINPARLPAGLSYQEYINVDLETIAIMADALLLLPGWEQSTGARLERELAEKLKLGIIILWGEKVKHAIKLLTAGLNEEKYCLKLTASTELKMQISGKIDELEKAIKAIKQHDKMKDCLLDIAVRLSTVFPLTADDRKALQKAEKIIGEAGK